MPEFQPQLGAIVFTLERVEDVRTLLQIESLKREVRSLLQNSAIGSKILQSIDEEEKIELREQKAMEAQQNIGKKKYAYRSKPVLSVDETDQDQVSEAERGEIGNITLTFNQLEILLALKEISLPSITEELIDRWKSTRPIYKRFESPPTSFLEIWRQIIQGFYREIKDYKDIQTDAEFELDPSKIVYNGNLDHLLQAFKEGCIVRPIIEAYPRNTRRTISASNFLRSVVNRNFVLKQNAYIQPIQRPESFLVKSQAPKLYRINPSQFIIVRYGKQKGNIAQSLPIADLPLTEAIKRPPILKFLVKFEDKKVSLEKKAEEELKNLQKALTLGMDFLSWEQAILLLGELYQQEKPPTSESFYELHLPAYIGLLNAAGKRAILELKHHFTYYVPGEDLGEELENVHNPSITFIDNLEWHHRIPSHFTI